ncbi:hypothetical protein PUV47_17200 [Pseudovibrio exalbescens]|uniref:hypothetical protein n=1 Tax=Pseudovibrio exalbescens TaxID=197461 RepID=UPI002365A1E3|nr:hypothetical protein [Pseudovibrio exalbescens]MDD7911672.1 hypothetical protein [Pseudovibrio exalbescens]
MVIGTRHFAVACFLCLLAGCQTDEERLPKAFSTEVAIPPGGYLLTVATNPIGARCHLAGQPNTLFIEPTPGYMVVPPGYENNDLVCAAQGYTTFRGEWISQPYPATNKILIEVLLSPDA